MNIQDLLLNEAGWRRYRRKPKPAVVKSKSAHHSPAYLETKKESDSYDCILKANPDYLCDPKNQDEINWKRMEYSMRLDEELVRQKKSRKYSFKETSEISSLRLAIPVLFRHLNGMCRHRFIKLPWLTYMTPQYIEEFPNEKSDKTRIARFPFGYDQLHAHCNNRSEVAYGFMFPEKTNITIFDIDNHFDEKKKENFDPLKIITAIHRLYDHYRGERVAISIEYRENLTSAHVVIWHRDQVDTDLRRAEGQDIARSLGIACEVYPFRKKGMKIPFWNQYNHILDNTGIIRIPEKGKFISPIETFADLHFSNGYFSPNPKAKFTNKELENFLSIMWNDFQVLNKISVHIPLPGDTCKKSACISSAAHNEKEKGKKKKNKIVTVEEIIEEDAQFISSFKGRCKNKWWKLITDYFLGKKIYPKGTRCQMMYFAILIAIEQGYNEQQIVDGLSMLFDLIPQTCWNSRIFSLSDVDRRRLYAANVRQIVSDYEERYRSDGLVAAVKKFTNTKRNIFKPETFDTYKSTKGNNTNYYFDAEYVLSDESKKFIKNNIAPVLPFKKTNGKEHSIADQAEKLTVVILKLVATKYGELSGISKSYFMETLETNFFWRPNNDQFYRLLNQLIASGLVERTKYKDLKNGNWKTRLFPYVFNLGIEGEKIAGELGIVKEEKSREIFTKNKEILIVRYKKKHIEKYLDYWK